MENHLLSFITNGSGDVITVHTDINGIDYLLSILGLLRTQMVRGECPHEHLFSADWGRGDLTTSKLSDQPEEEKIVHHVKIYGWTDSWKTKQNLL